MSHYHSWKDYNEQKGKTRPSPWVGEDAYDLLHTVEAIVGQVTGILPKLSGEMRADLHSELERIFREAPPAKASEFEREPPTPKLTPDQIREALAS